MELELTLALPLEPPLALALPLERVVALALEVALVPFRANSTTMGCQRSHGSWRTWYSWLLARRRNLARCDRVIPSGAWPVCT
jgi:hypothetical protein